MVETEHVLRQVTTFRCTVSHDVALAVCQRQAEWLELLWLTAQCNFTVGALTAFILYEFPRWNKQTHNWTSLITVQRKHKNNHFDNA